MGDRLSDAEALVEGNVGGVSSGAMSWGTRLITFGIASVAYTAAAMVAPLAIMGSEFLSGRNGAMDMDAAVFFSLTLITGVVAFFPFLMAKVVMIGFGKDGYFVHATAGAIVCILIVHLLLLQDMADNTMSPRWWEVLLSIGSAGLFGAVCGSTYWVVRALGWQIVRGVAR